MVGDVIVLVATLCQTCGAVSLFLDDFVEFDKYKTQISILILTRGASSNLVARRWCWWLAPPCWTTTDPLELEVTWCWTRESSNWRLTFDKGTEADSELKQ